MFANRLNLMVAAAENRVIGRDGRLPWKIPEDWAFFTNETRGGVLLMGRICFEGMQRLGYLGDRRYVVVSRNRSFAWLPGVHVVPTVEAAVATALRLTRGPVWICGGERIYRETLGLAGRLYLTLVHAQPEGDTRMPEWRDRFTQVIEKRESEDLNYRYTFLTLEPGQK